MIGQLIIQELQNIFFNQGPALVQKLLMALGLCFVLYVGIKIIVKKVEEKIEENTIQVTKYTKRTSHLVGIVIFIFLMVFNILIWFKVIGFDTGLVLGWLTIAIWFALENTIGNMVAGIMLLTNKKIKIGKSIKLLGSYNMIVKIEEFNIRYTVVRTLKKERILIPNMDLVSTPIESKKYEEKLRWSIHISLGRDKDLSYIKKILKDTINNHTHVIDKEKTEVLLKGWNPKGFEIICYYYFSPLQKKIDFTINSELRRDITRVFKENNVTFTYPHQVREVESQENLTKQSIK